MGSALQKETNKVNHSYGSKKDTKSKSGKQEDLIH